MNGLNRRRLGSHLSGWHVMTNFRSSLKADIGLVSVRLVPGADIKEGDLCLDTSEFL